MNNELTVAEHIDTPKTHIKYEGDGTRFVRYGLALEVGTVQEYTVLNRLHALAPENVVRPIRTVSNEHGEYIGYEMEFVEGTSLMQVAPTRKDAARLRKIVRRFHRAGLAHGDLNLQNIIKQKDGTITLIDPVGYDVADTATIEILQHHDRYMLDQARRRNNGRIRNGLTRIATKFLNTNS